MAIFRSLKTLITKNSKTRPFVTTTTTLFLKPPLYTPLSHRLPCFAPFQGPLFLSFPPWKLSQSATPLNGVFLRKVQALNSELIRDGIKLPSKLRFGSDVLNRAKDEVGRQGLLNSFVNLPNLVSMSRLVSGPFIGWMIMNEMYSSAFLALAISGATDWLDGYMARRMKINSVIGSYLDPLADKVLIGCVALAMVHMDLLHPALVGIVVLRDVALVGGAFYIRASSLGWKWKSWSDFINLDGTSPQKIEPLFLSKVAAELTLIQSFVKSRVHMVNTVFQLVLIAAALLQPEFGTPETQSYITYLSLLTASTTVASTIAYGGQYMRKKSALIARKL